MIYVQFGGRLGNWMFQYAMARSLRVPFRAYIPPSKWGMRLADYRELFREMDVTERLPRGVTVWRPPSFRYAPIPAFSSDVDVLLLGDWQSEKYFDRELVRRDFAPSESRVSYLRSRYGDWLSRPNVTGISVRRTDYLTMPELHPFLGEAYYERCLDRFPGVGDFVVCSDDIHWCKSFFSQRFPDKRFLFIEGESAIDQLYIHALCKNNIMSNSSFSWWSAWLNDFAGKRVLAPSMWFGCEARLSGLDWRDVYFDGVEIVQNDYTPRQFASAHLRQVWHMSLAQGRKVIPMIRRAKKIFG